MANIAAIYCRLSREDGDNKESNSISSQKEMLTEYAKSNGYDVFKIYVDDGYSGTNFNRPGFQVMLVDADKHLFDTILVKDLSRFGRNYIKTGYYTEEYFPDRDIKVIAVCDNYDSTNGDNDFVPIKNIVNEWYAKDISRKVKSTHRLHQEQGIIPTGKLPLYGYMYDKNRNRIPDPTTAHIVKEVFELYVEGKSREEICSILSSKKYVVPGYHYFIKYGYYKEKFSRYTEEQKYNWVPSMVGQIILSREYTGDLYVSKSHIKSFKNKKNILNKKENQKVHVKRFEPLISDELYEAASKLRTIRKRDRYRGVYEKKFYGLFKCYSCGVPLIYFGYETKSEGQVSSYYCNNKKCTCRTFIRTKETFALLDKELETLKRILSKKEEFIEYCGNYIEEVKEEDKPIDKSEDIKQLKLRNTQLDILIERLFEENINNRIPKSTFEKMVKKYNDEHQQNERIIEEYSKIPKKENINYKELAIEFINSIDSIEHNRDIVWLFRIFNGILIKSKKGIDRIICYDYGKLNIFVEAFKNESYNI